MYTLYHFPYSQHARRVVSLLEEAKIPYEIRNVAMMEGEHMSPEYLQINPNHKVPVLDDGDFRLTESNAILRYLCNKHKLNSWYPEDAQPRALVDQWLDWNQTRLAQVVVDIVLNKVFMAPNGDAEALAKGEQQLPELLEILNKTLSTQDYIAGNQPTIADLSIASNIFHLGFAEIMPEGKIAEWYSRVQDIQGFQKSLPPKP